MPRIANELGRSFLKSLGEFLNPLAVYPILGTGIYAFASLFYADQAPIISWTIFGFVVFTWGFILRIIRINLKKKENLLLSVQNTALEIIHGEPHDSEIQENPIGDPDEAHSIAQGDSNELLRYQRLSKTWAMSGLILPIAAVGIWFYFSPKVPESAEEEYLVLVNNIESNYYGHNLGDAARNEIVQRLDKESAKPEMRDMKPRIDRTISPVIYRDAAKGKLKELKVYDCMIWGEIKPKRDGLPLLAVSLTFLSDFFDEDFISGAGLKWDAVGRIDDVEVTLEESLLNSMDCSLFLGIGILKFHREDYLGAIETLKEALEKCQKENVENNTRHAILFLSLCYIRIQDYDSAESSLQDLEAMGSAPSGFGDAIKIIKQSIEASRRQASINELPKKGQVNTNPPQMAMYYSSKYGIESFSENGLWGLKSTSTGKILVKAKYYRINKIGEDFLLYFHPDVNDLEIPPNDSISLYYSKKKEFEAVRFTFSYSNILVSSTNLFEKSFNKNRWSPNLKTSSHRFKFHYYQDSDKLKSISRDNKPIEADFIERIGDLLIVYRREAKYHGAIISTKEHYWECFSDLVHQSDKTQKINSDFKGYKIKMNPCKQSSLLVAGWYFLDKKGNPIGGPYQYASDFFDYNSIVKINNTTWRTIDTTGRTLNQFTDVKPSQDSKVLLVRSTDSNDGWGVLTLGENDVKFEFDSIFSATSFGPENYFYTKKNSFWGLLGPRGNTILDVSEHRIELIKGYHKCIVLMSGGNWGIVPIRDDWDKIANPFKMGIYSAEPIRFDSYNGGRFICFQREKGYYLHNQFQQNASGPWAHLMVDSVEKETIGFRFQNTDSSFGVWLAGNPIEVDFEKYKPIEIKPLMPSQPIFFKTILGWGMCDQKGNVLIDPSYDGCEVNQKSVTFFINSRHGKVSSTFDFQGEKL